ncbi:MAG: SagB/ThcOx family dehydrogenase [Actinobacteria bacterium]|nr:SagB/ThcOx family dehydrogenase [Actinomycetota bacterium]
MHRLTSYEPGRDWTEPADDPRVVQDLRVNDLARLPWFFKRYPQRLPRLPLPRELPATAAPAIAVLAGTAQVAAAALDLPQLSRLLYLSAGVVRTMERPYGIHPFRAAGSAGGRFPLEVYVAVPDGGPLPPGVHWYDPAGHALVRVGPAPRGAAPAVVVTGVPWRTGWRYRERGWRHVYWDAGTMLSQLLALAGSAGLAADLYARFPDAAVAGLTGADRVHEIPVAVVGLGEGAPALAAAGPSAAGQVDTEPVEFPLVTAAQRAGERGRLGPPHDQGGPADVAITTPATVEAVIAARGSQRRMDATRGLPDEVLRTCMSVAVRGTGVPHWVVVHDVEGLAAGVYRWPDLRAPVRPGALRGELHRICLGQALARDAAFIAIAAAGISRLDDRQYREVQLAAGLAEGRLHLAAYALGASASGMTFIDSEVPTLLGEPLDALLFTCVGVPGYPSAAAGPPGAPSSVRGVTPRS